MGNYSVLMSVYRKEKAEYLDAAMQSMFEQTIPTDDFVLVCDGPLTDELEAVIAEMKSQYPEALNIVRLPNNKGLANALNEGLKLCKNELVARMDSDDISLPQRCEKQLKMFQENPNLSLLGTEIKTFDGKGEEIVRSAKTNITDIKKIMRRGNAFFHPTVMFKKSDVIACGGYDPSLTRRQDYDLFSKMLHSGYVASNICEVLLRYRSDNNWTVRNKNVETCRAKMKVQRRILKRKDCSIIDYAVVWVETIAARVLPDSIYRKIYMTLKGTV